MAAPLLWPSPGASQVVQGLVLDASAERPLGGAIVSLFRGAEPLGRMLTSDGGGFSLDAEGEGVYRLVVQHPGYVTYENAELLLSRGETVVVEIRLGVDAFPLNPLVVRARAKSHLVDFEQRRRAGASGRFLTRDQIEQRGASRTSQLLRGMGSVTFTEVGRGRGTLVRMHSGVGVCEPAIYVDGVRSGQSANSTIDDYLSPDMLDGVEVYTSLSGLPARYSAETCGVIGFWTRRGERGLGEPWNWKKTLLGLGVALLGILWIT